MNKRLARRLKGNEYGHMVPPMRIAHARDGHDQWITVACIQADNWSMRYTEQAAEILDRAIEKGGCLPPGVTKRGARAIASFLAELNETLVAAHHARWPLTTMGLSAPALSAPPDSAPSEGQ